LVDAEGLPRAGVDVSFNRTGDFFDPQVGVGLDRTWRTDKDGKFHAEGLVPGLKYTLRVWDKGVTGGPLFENLRVKAGETKDVGDVREKK
jgi:hypothetical protein